MATLWMKFPDEVLFCNRFSDVEQRNLEDVFSISDKQSPWMKALALLHLKMPQDSESLIKWHQGAPYFNWSSYAHVMSAGTMGTEKDSENGYRFAFNYKFKTIFAILAAQWHISRFLQSPPAGTDPLVESIALGIALQSLIFRLGDGQEHLAQWLATPMEAPKKHHMVLQQIQALQVRRTAISEAWDVVFTAKPETTFERDDLPDFFWDEPPTSIAKKVVPIAENDLAGEWKGMSVCGGVITGLAVALRPNANADDVRALKQKHNAPLILVFKSARPETTELFSCGDAVLFGTGGVLSHACTIAREVNLPSITALGADFFYFISENEGNIWLQIDGTTGRVMLIEK